MLGTELAYAEETWTHVAHRLDDYADRWVDQHTQACKATARGEQSEALLDRRMACLQRPLRTLQALTRALMSADEAMVRVANDAAANLPIPESRKPDSCWPAPSMNTRSSMLALAVSPNGLATPIRPITLSMRASAHG
jgi:hypothetical protein